MSKLVLHQVAPWNTALRNPYRTRYAVVGDRYFRMCAEDLAPSWEVDEIDADGNWLDLVATSLRLREAPAAIADYLAAHPAAPSEEDRRQRIESFLRGVGA